MTTTPLKGRRDGPLRIDHHLRDRRRRHDALDMATMPVCSLTALGRRTAVAVEG
jgi:hypothetical protein